MQLATRTLTRSTVSNILTSWSYVLYLSLLLRKTDRDLKLPLKKTNNGQKGYSFRVAKSWNGLSAGA